MKKNETLALIILILVTFGIGLGVFGVNKYQGKKLYTAELIAREPDHGNWYPRKITVSHGKEVKLLIRNIETVTHGFALPDFNVAVPEIKAGTVAEVRFTPDKKGTFPFMCTIWCSPRHMEMTGELIVE